MHRFLWLSWIFAYIHSRPSLIKTDRGTDHDVTCLWHVCLFGSGIIGYFAAPTEPAGLSITAIALAGTLSLFYLYRSHGSSFTSLSLSGLFVVACGFLYAHNTALSWVDVSFPTHITARQKPVSLSGRVVHATPLVSGHRVTFDSLTGEGVKPINPSSRVRLVIKTAFPFKPGQVLKLHAILRSPSAPVIPGGYDFQRYAWFQNIKAVGYAVSTPHIVSEPPFTLSLTGIEQIRHLIGQRFRAAASGDRGAVAAALITGERHAVSAPLTTAYRDAGLAHLLAISGLHIGIYTGLVFIIFRRGLSFIPAVCLRWPVKKVAAVLALAATTFYLLISGAGLPAQRAWMMSSCVLIAIILDRHAVTFRTVSFAALFACLWNPGSLLGPSFQMSFAAVLALVSGYMQINPLLSQWQQRAPTPTRAALRRISRYFLGVIFSTVLSTLATAPYTLYHFHRLPLYGLLANLIAVPITVLWVMPGLILALVLMPFGLEKVALIPLGWGLDGMATVAHTISSLPRAHLYSPPMSPTALLIATGSGIGLCVCHTRRRWIACLFFLCALISPWVWERRPDFIINAQGTLIAVSNADGLILSPGHGNRFTRRSWTEQWEHSTHPWPRAEGLDCYTSYCRLERAGQTLIFAKTRKALSEHCTKADVLVTPLIITPSQVPTSCRKVRLIDGNALQKNGTHTVFLSEEGSDIESVRAHQGARLWNRPT